ncbi:hypothetical protein [Candidatus Mycoplasma haematobovis]|uniref:hypothetical protein n=1 Tax=Candidatus Mycoplasma haematobovis TaxID=432608 RepID=UPI00164EDD89|nr:hypothetical protein [Candidatus Mycoplasma haematobovis]
MPVATVATATVATVSLVSFKKIDLDKNKDNEDRVLDDLELKAKDFKEKKMLYSKNGKNDSVTLEDDSLIEEILKKFQNNEDLVELEGKVPNIEELKKFLSENKDALANAPSLSDQEKSNKDLTLNKPSAVDQETNNGDTGLPNQLLSPQAPQSEHKDVNELGIQSEQGAQDDLGISRQDLDLGLDKKEESGDAFEQKEKKDLESKELTNMQGDSQLTQEEQDKDEETTKEVDKDKIDDGGLQQPSLQEPKDAILEKDSGKEEGSKTVPEELGPKSGEVQEQKEGRDIAIPNDSQTQDSASLNLGAKQLSESQGVDGSVKGDEKSTHEGTSSEGKKQLSLEEIQELENLKKEIEDLTNSLKILSL